ncbi:MAG: DUF480 domain-containing protein [Verrucomicrobia bacterium]|nr:DUF480 domain-containing protein [Verrucomicrobiota bacterium]
MALTGEEARVLGCLLEKAATTPDAYPLTLNSLVAACNQKSNRDPVVDYDEETVAEAIEGLRSKHLVFRWDGAGARVPKYKHHVDERLGLDSAGKALLAVLLLRGAQTLGQLRTRTERMHVFRDVAAVQQELDELAEETDPPLWEKIPPAQGRKEARYRHLLCGSPVHEETAAPPAPVESAMATVQARNERIERLESRVEELQAELADLKAAFEDFRKQFE